MRRIVLLIAAAVAIHLATPMVLTFDSGDYLDYLPILAGRESWSHWSVIRGPVFPLMISVTNRLLGASAIGLLVLSGVFLALLVAVIVRLARAALGEGRGPLVLASVLVCAFNPITFGWYHALLTEFVATTLFACCCVLAVAWVRVPARLHPRSRALGLAAAFAVLVPLAWHLKQPYVGVALFPLVAALVVALAREESHLARARRLLLFALPCVALGVSIAAWGAWLRRAGSVDAGHTSGAYFINMVLYGLPYWTRDGTLADWDAERLAADATLPPEVRDRMAAFARARPGYTSCVTLLVARDATGRTILTLPLYCSADRPTPGDALDFWVEQTRRLPAETVRAYASAYLEAVGLVRARHTSENVDIALRPYRLPRDSTNLLMAGHKEWTAAPYRTEGGTPFVARAPLALGTRLWLWLFTAVLTLSPLLWMPIAVVYVALPRWRPAGPWTLAFVVSLAAFLHIVAHVLLGATIDRYIAPVFPLSALVLILACAPLLRRGHAAHRGT